MKDPEFLGNFITINSPSDLGLLPDKFAFTTTFQREVVASRPIGVFITEDVEVTKVDLTGEVLTLSVGGMIFMIHTTEFQYPLEVKVV